MEKVSLKDLLEAGCHFGHQSQRWNPHAASFIYTKRDGIHIIDLVKTRDGLKAAADFVSKTLASGGTMLFLGTKRQAKEVLKAEAQRVGAFYVSEHWPAGLLTNFSIMKKNLDKMKDLEEKLGSEEKQAGFTKKEVLLWQKELKKLELQYGGIADLKRVPEVMFVVDVKHEAGAVKEAKKMGVKVVGIVDTNSDPSVVDFVIPANDDALGSITILVTHIADAVKEGMEIAEKMKADIEEVSKVPKVSKVSKGEAEEKLSNTEKAEITENTEEVKLEEPKTTPKTKTGRIAKEKKEVKKSQQNN